MLASDVLNRAQETLKDAGGVRWTQPELLRYLTDGQRETVIHKPDANVAVQNIALTPGALQTLPAGMNRLLSVTRNMGVGGTRPGRAITLAARGVLDAWRPSWMSMRGSTQIESYVFDDRSPRNFYVYPPAGDPAPSVEAMMSKVPEPVTDAGEALELDDLYLSALTEYVLYRAFMKDADFAGHMERAMSHYNVYGSLLGVKTAAGLMFSTRSSARDTRAAAGSSPAA